MQVVVARFELYPAEEPTGYCVGFQVTTRNGRSFYRDTVVPLADAAGKSDEEIAALAWQALKESIEAEVQRLESKPPLLGRPWTPPAEETTGVE